MREKQLISRQKIKFLLEKYVSKLLQIFLKERKYTLSNKIFFLLRNAGSSVMRGKQIKEELRRKNILAFSTRKISRISPGSIVIFVKDFSMIDLVILKNKGCKIVWDIVDYNKNYRFKDYFLRCDAVIFTSKHQKKYFLEYLKEDCITKVIYHHWDPRFKYKKNKKYFLNYFGVAPKINALFFNKAKIPIFLEFKDSLKFGPETAFHYSFRSKGSFEFKTKPTTKISIAAVCGSNIICSKDPSFLELLPKNYPFYCENNYKDLKLKIDYAKNDKNKEKWKKGLKMMEIVKEKTDIKNTIYDYLDFFKELNKNFR